MEVEGAGTMEFLSISLTRALYTMTDLAMSNCSEQKKSEGKANGHLGGASKSRRFELLLSDAVEETKHPRRPKQLDDELAEQFIEAMMANHNVSTSGLQVQQHMLEQTCRRAVLRDEEQSRQVPWLRDRLLWGVRRARGVLDRI